jgi:hypothetical protein
MTDEKLLTILAEDEGFDCPWDFVQAVAFDSVQPGICTVCTFTATRMEPDQREGWCEDCNKGTVKSASVLAGII